MITRTSHSVIRSVLSLGLLLSALQVQAQTNQYRQDQILVKPRVSVELNGFHQQTGTEVIRSFPLIDGLQVVRLPAGLSVEEAIRRFEASGLVWYAVPDRTDYQLEQIFPNDPRFTDGTLWGLHNTGQNGGTADADIDAPEGWERRASAPTVIVATTDTGARYTHEDLAANMWHNPDEIAANGIDDDGNGFIDDVYGADTVNNDADPMDEANGGSAGHGTHVAGTIAAVGSNSVGVVGVAWQARIMAVKVFGTNDFTSTSALAGGINYAIAKRAHIINASWSGGTFDVPIRDAIAAARNQGILFVAAAGNNNRDIDNQPRYPAAYDLDNIIAVAATTRTDAKATYSNWGLVKAHLAAPGGEPGSDPLDFSTWTNGIYSTWRTSDSAYQYLAGTSMAAPHVSGALALLHAYEAVESYVQLKNRLLQSTDPRDSFAGRSQTGGRLNLNGALNTTFWRPRNNNFASAYAIARPSSASSITFVANNVDATKETGEPNHAGNAGGKSVWWNWTAPDNNSATFTTKGSGFNTLLAVYTGSSVSGLTLVASDNDSGQCGTSQVTFTPTSGTTYRVAVDGHNGAHGTIKLNLQTSSAAQPTSLAFTLGSVQRPSGQFSVTVTGPASASVILDTSSDLSTWTLGYATITLSAGGSVAYTDASATPSVRFYRARITSSAQESCNIVGYVDRTMPAGDSMHCNPLNAIDNRVSALFAGVPEGTTIYKWNDGSQAWIGNGYEFGQWSDPNMTFVPGEGFLFQNNSAALTRSFVGEVALGHGVNPVPNLQSIRSSIVPQAGRVVTDLHLPVINGDTVSRMINGSYVTYTYSGGAWSPSEPSVSIGESFWNNKNIGFWWHRNFLVWP